MKLSKHLSRIGLTLFGCILMMTMVIPNVKAATGGFGVSGSFSSYIYKMVPGEQITTKGVDVVFFNNYDQDIRVSLEINGPKGVSFLLKSNIIRIKKNSNVSIPISLKVDKNAVPGEYEIGLVAEIMPDEITGIQLLGSAQLKTRLLIYGEAGEVSISTFDKDELPFVADLKVFRVNAGSVNDPVSESDTGLLSDRLVPGDYIVYAYYEGTEVAKKEFTLKDKDVLDIKLSAQTIFITNFMMSPQFDEKTDKIKNLKLIYTIKNIYKPAANVQLMVEVIKDNSFVEDLIMMSIPEVPLGETQGTYSYIPPEGWKNSTYGFRLHLTNVESISLGSGDVKEIKVSGLPESFDYWLRGIGFSVAGIAALVYIFFFYKRKKNTEPEVDEKIHLK